MGQAFGNILSDIYDMGNINLIKTVLLDNLGKYIDEMALNNWKALEELYMRLSNTLIITIVMRSS